MKVFILGVGKSGTTALLHKVAAGIPNCKSFSGGHPGKYVGNYKNAVYKHTYSERKGKSFDLYRSHLAKEHYDKKIWISRDPRDTAVSEMLFRWHRGYTGRKKQFQAHLDAVLKKEKDPRSVPFHEICRHAGHHHWPMTTEEVVESERTRYRKMTDFVTSLGDDWFLFTYEDMIASRYQELNRYLGFTAGEEAEVAAGYGKVVRKRASGDWRHWFTEEDVELFRPAYQPYMEAVGYDPDDWTLESNPVIEPRYASEYMQSLPKRVAKDTVIRYARRVLQRLGGR